MHFRFYVVLVQDMRRSFRHPVLVCKATVDIRVDRFQKRRHHTMKLRRGCSNPDSATTKRDQERKRR
jgi:hypothetical protein